MYKRRDPSGTYTILCLLSLIDWLVGCTSTRRVALDLHEATSTDVKTIGLPPATSDFSASGMGVKLIFTTALLVGLALSRKVAKEERRASLLYLPFCPIGVEEFCRRDPNCVRCEMAMPLRGEETNLPDAEHILTAFNNCLPKGLELLELPSVNGSRLARGQGRHGGTTNSRQPSSRQGSIHICEKIKERIAEFSNSTIATEVRCCFGQGIEKIDEKRKVNTTIIEQTLKSKLSEARNSKDGDADEEALNGLLKGVTECAAQITDCNLMDFKNCTLKSCINTLNG